MKIEIRTAREEDYLAVHSFIDRCEILVTHPLHLYRIVLRYFADTCFVAEQEGRVVGFQMGFYSQQNHDTYFLWQIGTDPSLRRQGVGRNLLTFAEEELARDGCRRIEVTIDPGNMPSFRLFEKRGYTVISDREPEAVEVNGLSAVKDFYGPGRHFILLEKEL